MQDACGDCLRQIVCEVTGASCPKLDALVPKIDSKTQEGDTIMSNTAKNTTPATPKTVAEAVAAEKTVPAQATEPKVKEDVVQETVAAEKKSVVQRIKAVAEKLKENRGAMIGLGFAAGFVSATVANKRRAAGLKVDEVTVLDVIEDTEIHQVGETDATDDSA
jgi:signal recognition particle subunit SEC65